MKKYFILLIISYFICSYTASFASAESFAPNPDLCKTSTGYAEWERSASFHGDDGFRIACRRQFCENQCVQKSTDEGQLQCPSAYAKQWCQNVCKGLRWNKQTLSKMNLCGIDPNPEEHFSPVEFAQCRRCYTEAEASLIHLEKIERELKSLYEPFLKIKPGKLKKFNKKEEAKISSCANDLEKILGNCHNSSCYQQVRACALARHLQDQILFLQARTPLSLRDRTNTSSTA